MEEEKEGDDKNEKVEKLGNRRKYIKIWRNTYISSEINDSV